MITSTSVSSFRILAGVMAIATGGLIAQAQAADISPVIKINEATAKADIKAETVRGNLTVLSGSGGNITVYNSPEGKLIIDAGIAVSKDKILNALKTIGPEPVKYLINTHYHWDHTDGNVWMHEAGATIIGTPQTVAHLSKDTRVDDWDFTFKPLPKEARPSIIVKGNKSMKFGGETFVMKNFGKGHTDSDIWVYVQKADVMVLGDIFWNPYFPFIDNENGGGINTAISWADKAIGAVTDKTVIVPGHGAVGTKADLVAWRDMLVDVRDRVAKMKKQGKSVAEVQAAKPAAAYEAKFGGFVINGTFFTKLVYDGL
jgi:glyoxylase-like metal-dependent hydrolase (beta-lactamase superfamily II)